LEMTHPSCFAACPDSYNISNLIGCLRVAQTAPSLIPGGQFGNVKTQEVKMQESLIDTVPYPTYGRGGRFCMPQDLGLRNSLLQNPLGLHPGGRIMRMVMAGTLGHLSWIFFVTTIIAAGLGYFFLWCIKFCPKAMARVLVYPASLLTGLVSIFFILSIMPLISPDLPFCQKYTQMNALYSQYTVTTASIISIVFCVISGILSMTLFGMGWNFDGAVAGDLVNAGLQCMTQVPGMYYLPAVSAVVKWLVFLFFVDGLRWFFTVGILHKNRIHVNGVQFAGLSRSWDWNRWWIISCVIWLVGFYWAMEIVNCFFEYLISKGTVAWYFSPKENGKKRKASSTWLKEGVKEAFLYHWGSIAYGAFFIPTWRPVRLFYWATASLGGDGAAPTTFLGKCLACVDVCSLSDCCGLKDTAKEQVESNESNIKDGFTDIVIRANDFPAASEKAHMLLEHSHKVVQYMYRDMTQTTLCVLGVTVIATVCACVTFLITTFTPDYKQPASALYIANPGLVVLLSWILGAYIAFGFMLAWDHTADTLLYCYAWNRQFSRKSVEKFIPECVRNIVGYDDKEEDRYPYYGKASSSMYLRSWIPIGDKSDKKKAAELPRGMPREGQGYSPQASWFNAGSWVGSMPPQQAPPGMTQPQEMQSLLQR